MDERLIERLVEALERMSPPPAREVDLSGADGFIWEPSPPALLKVPAISRVGLGLLKGIDLQKSILLDNTMRFAAGLPANNAMLWGARGTGKSSIVKAVHAETNAAHPGALALIEIHREDISTLPELLRLLRTARRRCLIFCDDLSFEREDADYKALKSVLDGGIEGRPSNVLFYATSNRRHLMPRDMIDNERQSAITPGEAVEEKVSLSDRFGLWIGFHSCDQETFFEMIEGYAREFALNVSRERLHAEAVAWSRTRGAMSGRVAWQFVQDLAGRLGVKL